MDVGYSAGMMNKLVYIARRVADQQESFGKNGSPKYEVFGPLWAAEDFNKGTKSLREGAFDAYDTVMFRLAYDARIDRWCLIKYNGKWYQIQSCNEDYQTNKIQITAIEMANQQVNIVEPKPEPEPTPTPDPEPTPTPEQTPDPEPTPEPNNNENESE